MSASLPLNPSHLQQVECLITLAEELHFGRTAERLGYSQSRASQLVTALERRVGARLVDRTSRRVSLTRHGEQFLAEVEPPYRALASAIGRARDNAVRGALCELRVGFTGVVYEEITRAFRTLKDSHGVSVRSRDIPLGTPFQAVLSGDVDAVIVELPVHEPELVTGFVFPAQDQFLAVGREHPLARRASVAFEELAGVDLLHRAGDAPDYWKAARTPSLTPSGRGISSTTAMSSIQEGLALAASGDHAMLACRPLSEHLQRSDVAFVPVSGLEGASQIALIWRRDHSSPALPTLARLLEESQGATHALGG